MERPQCLNFWVITSKNLGVQKFKTLFYCSKCEPSEKQTIYSILFVSFPVPVVKAVVFPLQLGH